MVEGGLDNKIIEALEDDRYKWRTADGVATELGVSTATVEEQIESLRSRGIVIRSTIPSAEGNALFTTRQHFQHKTPLTQRLLAAFKNRRGQ